MAINTHYKQINLTEPNYGENVARANKETLLTIIPADLIRRIVERGPPRGAGERGGGRLSRATKGGSAAPLSSSRYFDAYLRSRFSEVNWR